MAVLKIPKEIKKLHQEAIQASKEAYAPYSKFFVGAAVLLSDGTMIRGSNIENATYGLSICAERVAIAKWYPTKKKVKDVLVVVDSPSPVPPCGLCLQTMAEFFSPKLNVWLANKKGISKHYTLGELLPVTFTQKDLKIHSKKLKK